ncbi:MAG: tRNA-binding protein [Cyanobacteria bacterium J06639_1]
MEAIAFEDFLKVDLRVGKIISVEPLPQARKPAYVLHIDFGTDIGMKKSSAQITELYRPDDLFGKLVVAVVNFPAKQVGSIMSECLVTGFHDEDGRVALCIPEFPVPLGDKLA